MGLRELDHMINQSKDRIRNARGIMRASSGLTGGKWAMVVLFRCAECQILQRIRDVTIQDSRRDDPLSKGGLTMEIARPRTPALVIHRITPETVSGSVRFTCPSASRISAGEWLIVAGRSEDMYVRTVRHSGAGSMLVAVVTALPRGKGARPLEFEIVPEPRRARSGE